MIILDISGVKKRFSAWPADMPDKIRLCVGCHEKDYDFHPMVRGTSWYRKLVRNILKDPKGFSCSPQIPIGVSRTKAIKNGARIINI